MNSYVLDTNLFFNMDANLGFGRTTKEVILGLTHVMKKATESKQAKFLMSPRIVDEVMSFFDAEDDQGFKNLLQYVEVRSPDLGKNPVHLQFVYELIDDVRKRSYRGLQIAEEELEEMAQHMMGKETLPKKEFQMAVGPKIKGLRDRYRQATRAGFLDSLADFDLLALAKEEAGYIVTTDEGVKQWGRKFGVKEILPEVFVKQLAG